jgi:hypothetical protein
MDEKLAKEVAEYRWEASPIEELATVKQLSQWQLPRWPRQNRKCYIKSGPGCYEKIVGGDEVLAPTPTYSKSFPLGTPVEEMKKYFDGIKRDIMQDYRDLLGDSAETIIFVREAMSVVQKGNSVEATEKFGTVSFGKEENGN